MSGRQKQDIAKDRALAKRGLFEKNVLRSALRFYKQHIFNVCATHLQAKQKWVSIVKKSGAIRIGLIIRKSLFLRNVEIISWDLGTTGNGEKPARLCYLQYCCINPWGWSLTFVYLAVLTHCEPIQPTLKMAKKGQSPFVKIHGPICSFIKEALVWKGNSTAITIVLLPLKW